MYQIIHTYIDTYICIIQYIHTNVSYIPTAQCSRLRNTAVECSRLSSIWLPTRVEIQKTYRSLKMKSEKHKSLMGQFKKHKSLEMKLEKYKSLGIAEDFSRYERPRHCSHSAIICTCACACICTCICTCICHIGFFFRQTHRTQGTARF